MTPLRTVLSLGLPGAVLAFSAFLLALVLRTPRKTPLHDTFALFLGGVALGSLCVLALRASPTAEAALLWQRAALATWPVIGGAYLHFTLLLTRSLPSWGRGAYLYAPVGLLVLLALTPWVVRGVGVYPYGWGPVGGPLFVPWTVLVQAVLVVGIGVLLQAYQRTEAVDERNRYLYLAGGAAGAVVGLSTESLAAAGVLGVPFGVLGLLILLGLTALGAMQPRLVDVQEAARRGVVYLVASAGVAALYLVALLGISRWLAARTGLSLALQVLLLFGLALAFHPLVRALQERVDRWLYGRRYEYLRVLRSFAAATQSIEDLPGLVESLTRTVRLALRADGVWLLLPTPKGDLSPIQGDGPTLGAGSPLLRWLAQEGRPLWRRQIDTLPDLRQVPEGERQSLRDRDIRLLIPLRTPAGLTGVLALGPRQGMEPYTQAEVDLLVAVAQQVAASLENARLLALEREQVQRLREVDRLKSEFLGIISHQLKTPVTSLKAAIGLLQATEPLPSSPARSRLLSTVERSVSTLEHLVNELLEFAKVRSGQITLERAPAALQEVVREAVDILTPSIEAKGQRLVVDMPREPVVAMVDGRRLVQVVVNLLSNAHKYSPPDTEIALRLWKGDGEAVVAVTDSCGGIPEEEQRHLFEPYYRPRDASPDAAAGTGLGLSIAKGLVEAHGGRISFTNHPGRGCTMAFAVPLAGEAPARVDSHPEGEEAPWRPTGRSLSP